MIKILFQFPGEKRILNKWHWDTQVATWEKYKVESLFTIYST